MVVGQAPRRCPGSGWPGHPTPGQAKESGLHAQHPPALSHTLAVVRCPPRGVTNTTLTASAVRAAGVCCARAAAAAAAAAASAAEEGGAAGESWPSSSSTGRDSGPSWLPQLATATGWEEGRLAADMLAPEATELAREEGADGCQAAPAVRWGAVAGTVAGAAVMRSTRGGVAGATGCKWRGEGRGGRRDVLLGPLPGGRGAGTRLQFAFRLNWRR